MEDMERYGDYNEIDTPPSRSRGLLVLTILAGLVCFSVVLLLIIRIVMANRYPDFASTVLFDDVLSAHYNEKGGDISVLTQNIRTEYSDAEEGNIFCDNLFVIKEAGQLQISLRYNRSVEENLKKKFGVTVDTSKEGVFLFRLVRNNPDAATADEFDQRCVLGTLSVQKFDTGAQYGYYKLVFNGVDFDGAAFGNTLPSWIRLETFLNTGDGEFHDDKVFAYNLIYENNEVYSAFEEYELSEEEKP